jgi:hypothetical protein
VDVRIIPPKSQLFHGVAEGEAAKAESLKTEDLQLGESHASRSPAATRRAIMSGQNERSLRRTILNGRVILTAAFS